MKTIIMSLILSLSFVLPSFADDISGEKATRYECLTKVTQAVDLIQEVGVEAALKKIIDTSSSFIWKDTHVYCIDLENGSILAHPDPSAVGFSLRYYKDVFGDNPYDLVLDTINIKNQGWITYVTDGMGRKPTAKLKNLHYRKVPGKNIIVCSGYYPSF